MPTSVGLVARPQTPPLAWPRQADWSTRSSQPAVRYDPQPGEAGGGDADSFASTSGLLRRSPSPPPFPPPVPAGRLLTPARRPPAAAQDDSGSETQLRAAVSVAEAARSAMRARAAAAARRDAAHACVDARLREQLRAAVLAAETAAARVAELQDEVADLRQQLAGETLSPPRHPRAPADPEVLQLRTQVAQLTQALGEAKDALQLSNAARQQTEEAAFAAVEEATAAAAAARELSMNLSGAARPPEFVEVEVEVPVRVPFEVQVPVPEPVESVVEVPVERVVEQVVEVERRVEAVVETLVETPGAEVVCEQLVERAVEAVVEVERVAEQLVEVRVPYEVVRTEEVAVERVVESVVELVVEQLVEPPPPPPPPEPPEAELSADPARDPASPAAVYISGPARTRAAASGAGEEEEVPVELPKPVASYIPDYQMRRSSGDLFVLARQPVDECVHATNFGHTLGSEGPGSPAASGLLPQGVESAICGSAPHPVSAVSDPLLAEAEEAASAAVPVVTTVRQVPATPVRSYGTATASPSVRQSAASFPTGGWGPSTLRSLTPPGSRATPMQPSSASFPCAAAGTTPVELAVDPLRPIANARSTTPPGAGADPQASMGSFPYIATTPAEDLEPLARLSSPQLSQQASAGGRRLSSPAHSRLTRPSTQQHPRKSHRLTLPRSDDSRPSTPPLLAFPGHEVPAPPPTTPATAAPRSPSPHRTASTKPGFSAERTPTRSVQQHVTLTFSPSSATPTFRSGPSAARPGDSSVAAAHGPSDRLSSARAADSVDSILHTPLHRRTSRSDAPGRRHDLMPMDFSTAPPATWSRRSSASVSQAAPSHVSVAADARPSAHAVSEAAPPPQQSPLRTRTTAADFARQAARLKSRIAAAQTAFADATP